MSSTKMLCVATLMAISMTAVGCIGGGGDGGGRTARKRTGRKRSDAVASSSPKKSRNRAVSADSGEISLESSIKRDMDTLREKERKQAQTVEEMRRALNQGEDMVAKEEAKLGEIRAQIARYDGELRRFEQASLRGNPRHDNGDSVVASSMYTQPARAPGRNFAPADAARQYPQNYAQSEYNGYGQPMPNQGAAPRNQGYAANGYAPTNAPAGYGAHNEEVLFNGGSYQARGIPPQVYAGNGYDMNGQPGRVPMTQQPRPAASRRRTVDEESESWNPPSGLFSNSPATAGVPTLRRESPAGVAPASAPAPTREAAPSRTEPQAGARQPMAAPQSAPAVRQDEYADDEVFVPDLFLSGGR